MDKKLKDLVLRALEDTKAANLTAIEQDAMAIEAVIRERSDLSPVEVMVLINELRKP